MRARLLITCITLTALAGCTKPSPPVPQGSPAFFARHTAAMAKNPEGVTLELRTETGRTTYHLYEAIPIQWIFRSAKLDGYQIEMDESMNPAGQENFFDIDPVDGASTPWRFGSAHISSICCESDRQSLKSTPVVFHRELTNFYRFAKSGTYSLYLTSHRVFCKGCQPDPADESKISVTSNVLTLQILPDDPAWDSQQLAKAVATLDDPGVRTEYEELQTRATKMRGVSELAAFSIQNDEIPRSRLVRAQYDLNALDTTDAIHERVARFESKSPADEELSRTVTGYFGLPQHVLQSSTRPDLVASAMLERAQKPDFGVDSVYVRVWADYLARSRYPEDYFAQPLDAVPPQGPAAHGNAYFDARDEIAKTLQGLMGSKTKEAASTTRATIKSVHEDQAYERARSRDHVSPTH